MTARTHSSASVSITTPWWFTDRVIREYLLLCIPLVHGKLLDLGCGKRTYDDLFDVSCCVRLDINPNHLPSVIADVKDLPFGDGSFDAVMSNQVLEHIGDTGKVLGEIDRILIGGGIFVLTVPFIARVHGDPHDYWRFSEYGLRHWLERQEFSVKCIIPMGGFLTTQCYLWSFFIWERIGPLRRLRLLRVLSKIFFALSNVICWRIHKIDKDTTTPFNYLAIAQKAKV